MPTPVTEKHKDEATLVDYKVEMINLGSSTKAHKKEDLKEFVDAILKRLFIMRPKQRINCSNNKKN